MINFADFFLRLLMNKKITFYLLKVITFFDGKYDQYFSRNKI